VKELIRTLVGEVAAVICPERDLSFPNFDQLMRSQ